MQLHECLYTFPPNNVLTHCLISTEFDRGLEDNRIAIFFFFCENRQLTRENKKSLSLQLKENF